MESEIEELSPQMRTMSMSAIAFINPFRDDPTCDVTEDEDTELSSDDDSNEPMPIQSKTADVKLEHSLG